MLIADDGQFWGALSGGCVESEIVREARSVSKSGKPKVFLYDGRYRLGCEGLLYVLLEPVNVEPEFIAAFKGALINRETVDWVVHFEEKEFESEELGSVFYMQNNPWPLRPFASRLKSQHFSFEPKSRLVIAGAGHDAEALYKQADLLGWECIIWAPPSAKSRQNLFPNAEFIQQDPDWIQDFVWDEHTAFVIMNHSFNLDLKYLIRTIDLDLAFLGVLGSRKKREKLFNAIWEAKPDIEDELFEHVHAPVGLDLGAISANEIALSICSEIMAKLRQRSIASLRKRKSSLHRVSR
jgi:xanthine/CO dehydrogenase XdhC/CoxF family maturation factor